MLTKIAEWIIEFERYAIIVVSLFMAYAEIKQAIKFHGAWTKWALGFMGIYWASYYAYSIVRILTNTTWPSHQVFVRAGILLTVSLVGANAWRTLRILK